MKKKKLEKATVITSNSPYLRLLGGFNEVKYFLKKVLRIISGT